MKSVVLRQGLLGGGGSSLFVNGRVVNIDLNTFNLFSLLRTIRDESRQLERLMQLRLPTATARALLELGMSGGGDLSSRTGHVARDIRVDIVSGSKGGAIQFVNNLEKDPQYKRWPRSLRQLMYVLVGNFATRGFVRVWIFLPARCFLLLFRGHSPFLFLQVSNMELAHA
jgi:hypothetical protein